MNKKDTRLLPFIVEYERVMKSASLSDEEHDLQISAIMTEMENQFGIPFLNNEHFNNTFSECIDLYRKISDARIALGEEGVFQPGNKVTVVDGEQVRIAKAFDKKHTGHSTWYLCIDQTENFGYAFDEKTIDWNGSKFIYDCKKHNTPLSNLSGADDVFQ